jgi:hypothetical protein
VIIELASVSLSLLSVPGAVFAIVSVIVALTAILVFGRAAVAKAQIEALRGDRDDLMKRVDILEANDARQKIELEAAHHELEVLKQLVTGKAAVQQVLDKLIEHDERVAALAIAIARIDRNADSNAAVLKRIDRNTTPPGAPGAPARR